MQTSHILILHLKEIRTQKNQHRAIKIRMTLLLCYCLQSNDLSISRQWLCIPFLLLNPQTTNIAQTAFNHTFQDPWVGTLELADVWKWIDDFLMIVRGIFVRIIYQVPSMSSDNKCELDPSVLHIYLREGKSSCCDTILTTDSATVQRKDESCGAQRCKVIHLVSE